MKRGDTFVVVGPDAAVTWRLVAYLEGAWECEPVGMSAPAGLTWTFSEQFIRHCLGSAS